VSGSVRDVIKVGDRMHGHGPEQDIRLGAVCGNHGNGGLVERIGEDVLGLM
jgi:hypothetical protein